MRPVHALAHAQPPERGSPEAGAARSQEAAEEAGESWLCGTELPGGRSSWTQCTAFQAPAAQLSVISADACVVGKWRRRRGIRLAAGNATVAQRVAGLVPGGEVLRGDRLCAGGKSESLEMSAAR